MFLINISEILMHEGESISFSISEDVDINDYKSHINQFLSPVKVEGTVTNKKGKLELIAKISTKVYLCCDRCLKPVEYNISLDVDEFYTNKNIEEEAEVFTGSEIDISPVVKRSILFSLPMKVVCSEDCKGLCPVCGKDLNEGTCSCDTSYINPKFESLRSLFKIDEEV